MEEQARAAIADAEFMKSQEISRRIEPEKLRILMEQLKIEAGNPEFLEDNFPEADVIPVELRYVEDDITDAQTKLKLFKEEKQRVGVVDRIEQQLKRNRTYNFFYSHVEELGSDLQATSEVFAHFSTECGIRNANENI